jgi:tRNA nucleotidyltransferase (CCA-adding enzyme)
LNRPIHDWDICTSATPEQVMEVFKDEYIIPTGLQHGTVTIMLNGTGYEVTTYRIDGVYSDNRRPDSVTFTDSLIEDLRRRDFTINAMAYNVRTGLVDPFHGYNDIKDGLIKCVGNPVNRFNEDALRIMRAVRFAATCNFKIHQDTHDAMLSLRHLLAHVSEERKTTEFCKMLVCADKDLLLTYRDIFATFIPELTATFDFKQNNPHHIYMT